MQLVRLIIVLFALPSSVASAQAGPLARANWLAGCWELRTASRVTLEMWMPALGDVMLGASRTTAGGATREFEHIRLRAEGERIVYTALPSGQREASFPSILVTDTMLVFENTAHDFPQRISYRKLGADSIVAQIEGPGTSGPRRIEFPMKRASCTTATPPSGQEILFTAPRDRSSRDVDP